MVSPLLILLGLSPLPRQSQLAVPASSILVLYPAADTGASTPMLLTTDLLTTYSAANKAVMAYWRAHPDMNKKAQIDGKRIPVQTGNGQLEVSVVDYASWGRQDTSLATLLTQHNFTPVQFEAAKNAVTSAIRELLDGRRPDTGFVMGKNMVLVNSHRPDLALDFQEQQQLRQFAQGMMNQIFQGIGQQVGTKPVTSDSSQH